MTKLTKKDIERLPSGGLKTTLMQEALATSSEKLLVLLMKYCQITVLVF